jgi:hypothetical protein
MKLLVRIAFFKIVCYEDTILNCYQNRVSITVLPKHDFKVKLEIFFFYNSSTPCILKLWVQDTVSTVKFVFPKYDFKKRLLCEIISKQQQFNKLILNDEFTPTFRLHCF